MPAIQFDARTVQPMVGVEPLPDGWYKVAITKSNIKPTKAGDGGFLELILTVAEGQYQGRFCYWNLNLWNPSQAAVEIAHKQLSAISHVVNQYQVTSQDNTPDNIVPMLHNIPFFAHIVVTQGNQGPMNNIRGLKDVNGNDPGKQGGTVVAQPGGFPGNTAPQTQAAPPADKPAWSPNNATGGAGGAPSSNAPSWNAPNPQAQTQAAPQAQQQAAPADKPAAWSPPNAAAPSNAAPASAPWQR